MMFSDGGFLGRKGDGSRFLVLLCESAHRPRSRPRKTVPGLENDSRPLLSSPVCPIDDCLSGLPAANCEHMMVTPLQPLLNHLIGSLGNVAPEKAAELQSLLDSHGISFTIEDRSPNFSMLR